MPNLRRWFKCFVLVSAISLVVLVYMTPYKLRVITSDSYLIDTPGCKMPGWNPFHESVLPFYEEVPVPYNCERQRSFLVVKSGATVVLDPLALEEKHKMKQDSLRCTYQEVLRDPRLSDDKIFTTKQRKLVFGVPMKADFIYVQCYTAKTMIHDEFLALTPLKEQVEKRCSKSEAEFRSEDRLNVIVLGVDSISKLNFDRHFKKTGEFLRNQLGAYEMKGYNKVGENTFPNLVPLLTGRFATDYWNETLRDMSFDDLDLVWKHYASAGYRTLLAEDAPDIATFNYLRKGFRKPPTDYYFRPMALALERSAVRRRSKDFCFDDRLETKVLFDYTRSFVETMGPRPTFAFTFAARLTHDEVNNAAFADEPTHEILWSLHKSNVTNNSLLIFMSDHGLRFGGIAQTYIGRYEERWPVLFLSFPEWFLKRHPDLAGHLSTNQHRLTTPFDVHATLVDLLGLTTAGMTQVKAHVHPQSWSLLRRIPPNRTCDEAAISPHFCTCYVQEEVTTNSPLVKSASRVVEATLNDMLRPHFNLCSELSLKEVMEARISRAPVGVLKGTSADHAPVQMAVQMSFEPSGAIYEATVYCGRTNSECVFKGDVSRLNRYGSQGDCVQGAELRKFCYCKNRIRMWRKPRSKRKKV